MSDSFQGVYRTLESPIEDGAEVTPNDGADLANASRVIYVGTAGHLRVTLVGGETAVNFSNLAVGWHPIRARRIWATGTTAADIVAGW